MNASAAAAVRRAVPNWPGWQRLPREARDTLFLLGVIAWTVLPHVFVLMGGSGRTLHEAVVYSSWWFAGAVLTWLAAFMSALR